MPSLKAFYDRGRENKVKWVQRNPGDIAAAYFREASGKRVAALYLSHGKEQSDRELLAQSYGAVSEVQFVHPETLLSAEYQGVFLTSAHNQ